MRHPYPQALHKSRVTSACLLAVQHLLAFLRSPCGLTTEAGLGPDLGCPSKPSGLSLLCSRAHP